MSMGRSEDDEYERMNELSLKDEDQDSEDGAGIDCGDAIN